HCSRSVADKLVATEPVDLIAPKTERTILGHHRGVEPGGGDVTVRVVLLAVDLDHDADGVGQQEQEIHTLARQPIRLAELPALLRGQRVEVKVHLREQGRLMVYGSPLEAVIVSTKYLLFGPISFDTVQQPLVETALRVVGRRAGLAELGRPPVM